MFDLYGWQGRASAVFVWKADQRYPMALFEQGEGVNVPALAIERTPWGHQPEGETVRLVSCSSTGKVGNHLASDLSINTEAACWPVCPSVCLSVSLSARCNDPSYSWQSTVTALPHVHITRSCCYRTVHRLSLF